MIHVFEKNARENIFEQDAKTTLSEKEVLPRNPPELWDVDNLMSHEARFSLKVVSFFSPFPQFLHEASLIETLTIRYNRACIYVGLSTCPCSSPLFQTYSGPVLISLNPYRYLDIYGAIFFSGCKDERKTGSDYIKKFRGANLDKALPHVYAIAEGAYKHLMDDKRNQSILITFFFRSISSFSPAFFSVENLGPGRQKRPS